MSPFFKDPIKHDTVILNLTPIQLNGLGETSYKMHNKTKYYFLFLTSHECTVFVTYITWYLGLFLFVFLKEGKMTVSYRRYTARIQQTGPRSARDITHFVSFFVKGQSSVLHYIFYLHRESLKDLWEWDNAHTRHSSERNKWGNKLYYHRFQETNSQHFVVCLCVSMAHWTASTWNVYSDGQTTQHKHLYKVLLLQCNYSKISTIIIYLFPKTVMFIEIMIIE